MAKQTINELRDFPAIEELLQDPALETAVRSIPRPQATEIIREVVSDFKAQFQKSPKPLSLEDLRDAITQAILVTGREEMIRVINATGIIVHTNLGRAPLPAKILASVIPAVTGYSNVEFDLGTGQRGSRGRACEGRLANLSGAESATVVNNCAAALFIILNTLASRKRVIISRGELVQIGGGFRIPDILKRAGAKLCEVGTTNITTLSDYESAIDSNTALILKVHKSNFVQAGFTEEVTLRDLVTLGRKSNIPVVNDLGSGVFVETKELLGYSEPTVQQSVRAGAYLTCFSGDKLLGGTQAGLIVGDKLLVQKIKKNPLFRAVRVDKIVFAMLEQLLASYMKGSHIDEVPIWHMLSTPASELYQSGKQILKELGSPDGVSVEATKAYVGGGALPESDIPSVAIVFAPAISAEKLLAAFRRLDPPIIGRIADDRFLLDLKAIDKSDYPYLVSSISTIISSFK